MTPGSGLPDHRLRHRLRAAKAASKRLVERAQDSLPVAIGQRFVEIDLLTHAASLSFFALLSLAPLLVLLLWLTASLYPSAQLALVEQVGEIAGSGERYVADTVLRTGAAPPGVSHVGGASAAGAS